MNPLSIELVLELVLQHVQPKYLLDCRLVNHLWNEVAARLLKQEGWTIHLTGVEQVEEYLQTIRATASSNDALKAPLARMELSIHTGNGDETGFTCQTMEAAVEITKLALEGHCSNPPFIYLECTIGRNGIESPLMNFIKLNASTLRQASIHFFESEEGHGNGRNSEVVQNLDELPQLPGLRSITLEYTSLSLRLAPAVTRALLRAAANLEHIQVNGFAMSPVLALALSESSGVGEPPKLEKLQELELYKAQLLDYMLLVRAANQFSRLHLLRVKCVGLGVLGRLVRFVRANCPELVTLQVVDSPPQTLREADHEPPPAGAGGEGAGAGEGDQQQQLLQVTHFGFRMRPLPETPWVCNRVLADAEVILRTMFGIPNLKTVSSNFEGWISIARLFTSLGGNCKSPQLRFLPAVFRQSKWIGVTRLELAVTHAAVYATPDETLLHTIVFLINEMFPSLEELVIELGMDSVAWKRETDLGYLLRFALGVNGARRVEIRNFYGAWTLGEMEQGPNQRESNSGLKELTIHAALPSFTKTLESPPIMGLHQLLNVIPNRLDLELRLDAELLLNGQHSSAETAEHEHEHAHNSFEELLEISRNMQSPRLTLI